MIADALDPDGTFTAAKVSRKLKQLGLYLPKKKKSASNLQLRDEAFSDSADDETLLSMRIRYPISLCAHADWYSKLKATLPFS